MLTLSQLKFAVDTSELERAAVKLKEVSTAIQALDAKQTRSGVNQAKVSQAQSRAEKEAALADKAKTQAEREKAKAIKDTEAATESATKAISKQTTTLERQESILALMAQGYSKGQASIIATAKAAGTAADEITELGKVLQTQRTLMGNDPFDKSLGSLRSLQNEFKSLKEVQRLYAADLPLTGKQMQNLALDKLRLIEVSKVEGRTLTQLKQSIKDLNAEYIQTANNVNRMTEADKAIVKSRQDAAKANDYLSREMERVNFASQTMNKELGSGTNNALLRFERALKQSGLTLDEQQSKLAAYRTQLVALQTVQKKSNTDYISRALGPQITDIFVGLATGQAPLTVMLQQGGQLRDQFALAGIAAKDMGDTMRTAARQMVTSVFAVAGAFKDLLIGAIIDTGKGITNMASNMLGLNVVFEGTKRYFASLGEAGFKYIGVLDKIGKAASLAFGLGLAAGVAGLVSLGVALYDVIKRENELTKALALNTGTFGMGLDSAVRYSEALSGASGTTEQFMQVIGAMAKEGNFAKEEISAVGTAAIQMSKYFEVSIEDTVKAFAKLKEDPVKNLIELAKQTGLVSDATIKSVIEFDKQGNKAAATALAIKSMADVNSEQVERMKKDYNGFALFITELGSKISQFFSQAFKDLFRADGDAMRQSLEKIDKEIAKRTNANGEANMFQSSSVEAFKAQRERLLNSIAIRDIEEKAAEQRIADNQKQVKQTELYNNMRLKGVTDVMKKEDELVQFRASIKANPPRNDEERLIALDAEKKLLKEIADAKKKYTDKGDTKSENYFAALMREATNNTLEAVNATNELTKSEQKLLEVKADSRFAKLSSEEKARVIAKYENAAATEKLNQVEELREKLLGKSSRLGKDYYDTLNQIVKLYNGGNGRISGSEFDQMLKALNESTPAAKEAAKAIEAMEKSMAKYAEHVQNTYDKVQQENEALDLREALLGKSAEDQRKIRIEYEKNIALLKVEAGLQKEINRIKNDPNLDNYPEQRAAAIIAAEQAAVAQRLLINREVAVKSAEYLWEEYNRIRDGISDSIVTALFEGGKGGSKKLREVLVAELRKPVTLVVNAMVNTVLGGALQSLLKGGSSGGMGSLGQIWDTVSSGFNIAGQSGAGLMRAADMAYNLGMDTAGGMIDSFRYGMMDTASMSSFSSAFSASGAQMAGAIVGSVMNGFSGYSISKLISGGYELNSGVNKIAGIASAIPGIGPIAGVIGGVINRLFGRKLKESGIEGTFGGETGFEGNRYEYYKGGLFRSNKTKRSELEEETRKGFADSYKDLKDNVTDMAKALGLGSDALKDFTYSFKVDLKGLSEEEAAKKLAEQFDLMGVAMAELVLTTNEYAQGEETRLETLTRLGTALTGVNTIFENMGMTIFEASLKGADAASELLDGFGGLQNFTSVMSSYYSKFFNQEEQKALLQTQVDKSFKDLNTTTPKTREEFRALVEAQDLTTEAGRKMFTQLMALVEGFDALQSQAEELAESIKTNRFDLTQRTLLAEADVYDAQGNTGMASTQRRAALDLRRKQEYDALYKLDPELAKMVANVWALEDAAAESNKKLEISNKAFDINQKILALQGREGEALALSRKKEIDALWKLDPALAKLTEDLWRLEDAAAKNSKRFDLTQRLLIAEGKEREALDLRRKQEYDALWKLDPELADMVARIWALEDAAAAEAAASKKAQEARSKAYSALEMAVAAEKALVADRIKIAEDSLNAMKSFFETLKSGVDELYNQVESTSQMSYMAARALINSTFATVKAGGSVTPNDALTTAVQTSVSGVQANNYSTKTEFDRERLRLAAELAVLKDATAVAITVEEKMLESLRDQEKALDATLEYWKRQIEIADGTYTAVVSVAQAINDLTSLLTPKPIPDATGTPSTGTGIGSGSSPTFGGNTPSGAGSSSLGSYYIDDDGRVHYADGSVSAPRHNWTDSTGSVVWAKNSPLNPANLGKNLPELPAFADGGMYNGGVALVGERGPELINFNKPASIYSSNNTSAILGNSSDNEELKRVNKALLVKLEDIANSTKKTADTLRNVSPAGDSLSIESETLLEI